MALLNGKDSQQSSDRERFEIELEFVQCLASPSYLHYLAQNQFLDNGAFLRYLGYLLYWTKPAYVKFVAYPHALYFLQLLQHAEFRSALKSPQYALLLHQQQGYHWQFASSSRLHPRDVDSSRPAPAVSVNPQVSKMPSPNVPDPSSSPEMDTSAQSPATLQTRAPSPVAASQSS